MSVTFEPKKCPQCGAAIPPEAPQGLCPKCLLARASLPTEAQAAAKPSPPSRQELAAAFPQLEILELIGQGGMGFVFKARQPKLERLVALKILPPSFAADPAFADRFTREGRVLARLNHPNIVTVHDFGQANGFFYLLMEFVDGVNLRQAMRAGRFTPEQALNVVPRICEALQFAHNEGVLHRDIKPENILLDAKGRVKIADFGIAKLLGESAAKGHLTDSGGTLGTPHYMAPEQIENPASVDHRADIYSLGVVFYEMLTGELPLGRFQPPSQKVQVDVRLDEVVLHALEKEPARRYQQASEVKTAVDTIASAPPAAAAADLNRRPAPASQAPTQNSGLFWRRLFIGTVTVLAALAFLSLIRARQAREQALRAEMEARQAQERVGSLPTETKGGAAASSAKLVIDNETFGPANPEPGQLSWGFKVFVPPQHLATFLFVRWTDGVPTVDPRFSRYFKVGPAGGIDVPYCTISCFPIAASQLEHMTKESLSKWGIRGGVVGETNVVQWNINLGLNFTASAWVAMPDYHRTETPANIGIIQPIAPTLPQSVQTGHQLSLPLVEFDRSSTNGWSGIDLRVFLEPLRSPPIRMLPNEKDMSNHVAATGLPWTMEEALARIRNSPMNP
jgi:tRNA A-37 threonylcarbamoyl transferase component Bud32